MFAHSITARTPIRCSEQETLMTLNNLFLFKDGNIPLFAAVEAGNLHVCRELLLVDTEAQLKYTKPPLKDTALHLAARKRDNDLVKLFIEAGAFVDSQNVSKTSVNNRVVAP